MSKYEIIIYWSEEDGAFIAEVPELAGCLADGATYQEALANAEIIIAEWIETRGIWAENSRTERQISFCITNYGTSKNRNYRRQWFISDAGIDGCKRSRG